MRPTPLSLPFPVLGVSKRLAYEVQPQSTTPAALNVWPAQPETGRLRGGTRPGLTALAGSIGGTPAHHCQMTYKGSGSSQSNWINRGVAVVTNGTGTRVTINDGATWTTAIAQDPGSDFCSVGMFEQKLIQASYGLEKIYYYDYAAASGGNLTDDATAGTAPTYAGVVCVHGGRLLVGGIKDEPHVVRGSALGNILDWDGTSPTASSAFSTTGSGNSAIGERIVVIFEHNRDCALVGGPDSCYMIRGNPSGNTGNIYLISRGVGPLMMAAICKGPDDGTYFLSRLGPHMIPSGCGQAPIPIALENIPEDLMGVDPAAGDHASCACDYRWGMIHFYVDRNTGDDVHWAYDVLRKSWWPMSFGSTARLAVEIPMLGAADVATVCHVTSGGTISKFDRDSTESMDSYVDWMIPLAGPGDEGQLFWLNAILAEDSDDVDWAAYVEESAQQAVAASTANASGTWDRQGLNILRRTRLRGEFARVRCSASGTERISIESLLAGVGPTSSRRPDQ